jgi:hypothetical protein
MGDAQQGNQPLFARQVDLFKGVFALQPVRPYSSTTRYWFLSR